MKPLVTIIIPSYNHSKYIEDSIKSVLNQTYDNIKLVVIDDGSTDQSPRIIEACLHKYQNRFIYIQKKNEGLVKTLNYALNFIEGDYYQALASDDVIYETKIEKQVNYLETHKDEAMVYSDCHRFYEKSRMKILASMDYSFKGGDIFVDLYTSLFSIPALSVLIRTDIIKKYGYLNEFQIEDWVLWLRISKSYKIGYIDESLALYRIHSNNMHSKFKMTENEKDKAIIYIANCYSIDKEIVELAFANSKYKQARNYNRGVLYCKKQFVIGLIKKLHKKMTIKINLKDILKFIFKWWK